MPRKAAVRKTEKKSKTVDDDKKSNEKKVVSKTEKVSKKSQKKEPVVEETPVSDVEETPVDDSTQLESVLDDESTKKTRSAPTRESVSKGFDELVSVIEEEISKLRETQGKSKGVKFLRSLGKRVKTIRGQSLRVMKQKHRSVRKNNTNSGFLKPVQISKEMAKFTGWDPETLRSRVDVTKYICNYIRENNLQNPSDRREIVADSKLSKLLNYDAKKSSDPLTYYRIQSYIKPHFIKDEKK